uniref:Uncharacterized protein LOC111118077 n=1 Tax=Crassostrea virginica TaxID=6565 RepID=A0A8B8CBN1_CRAVI|nr:uncharacterized protein LOC111118077 [Crassostrea virginica]
MIVNQERKGEIVDFPSGTLSLSHEPSGLKEKADDIIIVHQGTPEELINVVQETLQEIMGVPQGNHISQGTSEEVTFYDETGKEITGFSAGTVEEILGMAQEITIPHGSVDEIMGIPKGIPVPKETLYEILGIMATVPDETIQEIMGFPQGTAVPQGVPIPQGINIPQGTQGQAYPVHNQNRCEGNSGHRQEQLSFRKVHSDTATTSNVTAQHQLSPSCNQLMQSLTQQTSPVQENPLPGGTTQGRASDPDPLLTSLLVPTNASWGGNSELQKSNGNSLVKDTMIYDYDLNGSCRKRKIATEKEDTSSKRQRRDQTTNLVIGNYDIDAGLMVLPERSLENEEFFASIEKCLELSSENDHFNEKYALLEDIDNASLETFPSKVIDDIYRNTFESDRFLASDDDFVTDSLAFMKQGGDFELGALW